LSVSRTIINADDFGISPEVSRDIARCFQAGSISSTTIMANLPHFEHACGLARKNGFSDRIGVHLNLTHGQPLSATMKDLCGETGQLSMPERRFWASPELSRAVYAEVSAQLCRVREAGIVPTHIDSHEHIINGFPYTRAALRAAREAGVRRVRLTRNAFFSGSPLKRLFKWSYNQYLRVAGMRTTRYFTDVKPYFLHVGAGGKPLPGTLELMCHPGARIGNPEVGFPSETELLLSEGFGEFLKGLHLVSYSEV